MTKKMTIMNFFSIASHHQILRTDDRFKLKKTVDLVLVDVYQRHAHERA